MLFGLFPTKKGLRDPCGRQGEEGLVGSIPGPTFLLQPKALSSFQPKQPPAFPSSPPAFLLYLLVHFQQVVVGGLLSGQALARDTVMNKTDGPLSILKVHSTVEGKASNN